VRCPPLCRTSRADAKPTCLSTHRPTQQSSTYNEWHMGNIMVAWSMTLREPFWQKRHLRMGAGEQLPPPQLRSKQKIICSACKTTHTCRHIIARRLRCHCDVQTVCMHKYVTTRPPIVPQFDVSFPENLRKIVATGCEIFSLKFTKYRLAAGLRQDPLGELKRSPDPLPVIRRPTSNIGVARGGPEGPSPPANEKKISKPAL